MRHDRVSTRQVSILLRKRFQFAGALLVATLIPWFARGPLLPGSMFEPASLNTLAAQCRGGDHRLLDAALDRDLSRHPPQLGDLARGADRSRRGGGVVLADPLPL